MSYNRKTLLILLVVAGTLFCQGCGEQEVVNLLRPYFPNVQAWNSSGVMYVNTNVTGFSPKVVWEIFGEFRQRFLQQSSENPLISLMISTVVIYCGDYQVTWDLTTGVANMNRSR